jgi:hypothetical protein
MDLISKNIARAFIKTIGTDKIANMAGTIINEVITQKKAIQLNPGEDDIIGIVYEKNGTAYFAQCIIHDNDEGVTEILRFEKVTPITELLQTLLNNI